MSLKEVQHHAVTTLQDEGTFAVDNSRKPRARSKQRHWFPPREVQLLQSVQAGRLTEVRRLIDGGVDVECKDKNGHTPLHYACAFIHQNSSDELVDFLITRGADVNAQTFWGNTPLNLATGRGNIEIVKHLLRAGATINGVTGDDTALHVACERGYLNLAKELVRLGADPNALGFGGVTPIYYASAHGKLDVLDWLLSLEGIQFDTSKRNGCTPLFAACQNGYVDTVSRLMQTGASIQTRNIRGSTPLGVASANGHAAVVQRLLLAGADMDAKNNAGASPIHLASRNGFSHVVGLLLDNGANIDGREISVAFENGHFDTCQLLVVWLSTIGRLTVTI